jgi:DNA-binding NtrC family response regulator
MPNEKILVVDDEKLIRWSISQSLVKDGYTIFEAETGEAGLEIVEQENPEVVLLDNRLPGKQGLLILKEIHERFPRTAVIIITAYGSIETAVEAMKAGATDFIKKPFDIQEIKLMIQKVLDTNRLRRELDQVRDEKRSLYGFPNIIGRSPGIAQVIEIARKVAESNAATVLIQGDSGTGKDLLARAIHYESARAPRPFMEIDCSTVPETLIESELFGHERGAFTDARERKYGLFELADGGTVFLDEISNLAPAAQAKLLRVIENRAFKRVGGVEDIKIDVRIIAATNIELSKAVEAGKFREDLYYRLKVIPIVLPPLAERPGDIPLLLNYFIEKFNREFRKQVAGVSPEALQLLEQYAWPGNVRELKNVLERIMILGSDPIIRPEHLPAEIVHRPAPLPAGTATLPPAGLGLGLEETEKNLILQALEASHGNQIQAARILKISRDTLRYRMKKFNIPSAREPRT